MEISIARSTTGALALILSGPCLAITPGLAAIGEACDPGSGKLLYLEYHYRDSTAASGKVEYIGPNQQTLAIKTLDFSANATAPAFRQLDRRNGQLIAAAYNGAALTLRYRKNHDDELAEKPLDYQEPVVVDVGFDDFIRQNWSALTEGDEVPFRFAVPTRLSTITLNARAHPCDTGTHATSMVCFRVKPKNWMIGLLMKPIDLQYNAEDRRLMQFSGLGNLHDQNGKPMEVSIRYRYLQPGAEETTAHCSEAGVNPTPFELAT